MVIIAIMLFKGLLADTVLFDVRSQENCTTIQIGQSEKDYRGTEVNRGVQPTNIRGKKITSLGHIVVSRDREDNAAAGKDLESDWQLARAGDNVRQGVAGEEQLKEQQARRPLLQQGEQQGLHNCF